MKEAKLLLGLITIVLVTFVLFLSLAIVYSIRMIPNVIQNNGDNLAAIYAGHDKEQLFQSNQDNINVVFVRLKNIGILNKDPFIFTIRAGRKVLKEVKISGQNIGDDDWVKFQFEKVENVENKTLSFNLHSDTARKEAAILAYTNKSDELSYKVYSKENLSTGMKILIRSFFNRFMVDKLFVIFYIAIISALLIILFSKRHAKTS